MDAVLTTLAPILGAEALKSWGSFAICLIVLGSMFWRSEQASKKKDAEIATLRAENKALQDARLDDVRQMIRVTESSTLTAAARAQGDSSFLDTFRSIMEAFVDRLEAVEGRLPPLLPAPPPRAPRHRGPR